MLVRVQNTMSASAIFVLDLKGKVRQTLVLIVNTVGTLLDGYRIYSQVIQKHTYTHPLTVQVKF